MRMLLPARGVSLKINEALLTDLVEAVARTSRWPPTIADSIRRAISLYASIAASQSQFRLQRWPEPPAPDELGRDQERAQQALKVHFAWGNDATTLDEADDAAVMRAQAEIDI